MSHKFESHDEVPLIRQAFYYLIEIADGREEWFRLHTDANKRVIKIIKNKKLKLKPYKLEYFRLNGKKVKLRKQKIQSRVVHMVKLPEEASAVEYCFTMYEMIDGVYASTIGRFAKQFSFSIQKYHDLDYEFTSLGGLPQLEPVRREPFEDVDGINLSNLCFPDQGYQIQWYPRDGRNN